MRNACALASSLTSTWMAIDVLKDIHTRVLKLDDTGTFATDGTMYSLLLRSSTTNGSVMVVLRIVHGIITHAVYIHDTIIMYIRCQNDTTSPILHVMYFSPVHIAEHQS